MNCLLIVFVSIVCLQLVNGAATNIDMVRESATPSGGLEDPGQKEDKDATGKAAAASNGNSPDRDAELEEAAASAQEPLPKPATKPEVSLSSSKPEVRDKELDGDAPSTEDKEAAARLDGDPSRATKPEVSLSEPEVRYKDPAPPMLSPAPPMLSPAPPMLRATEAEYSLSSSESEEGDKEATCLRYNTIKDNNKNEAESKDETKDNTEYYRLIKINNGVNDEYLNTGVEEVIQIDNLMTEDECKSIKYNSDNPCWGELDQRIRKTLLGRTRMIFERLYLNTDDPKSVLINIAKWDKLQKEISKESSKLADLVNPTSTQNQPTYYKAADLGSQQSFLCTPALIGDKIFKYDDHAIKTELQKKVNDIHIGARHVTGDCFKLLKFVKCGYSVASQTQATVGILSSFAGRNSTPSQQEMNFYILRAVCAFAALEYGGKVTTYVFPNIYLTFTQETRTDSQGQEETFYARTVFKEIDHENNNIYINEDSIDENLFYSYQIHTSSTG